MFIVVRIIVLYGLVQLLITTRRPLLCAGIYAVISGLLGFVFGLPIPTIGIRMVMALVLSLVYFGLLSRINPGSALWWPVLIGGFVIGLV